MQQSRMGLHPQLRLAVVCLAAYAQGAPRPRAAHALPARRVASNVTGSPFYALYARRPDQFNHHHNKTAESVGKAMKSAKYVAAFPFPWWLAPGWAPVWFKPWAKSWFKPWDKTDEDATIEEVEEVVDEVEEEVEIIEVYEKRKWLHIFESRTFFDWAVFGVFAMFFLWVYHRFVIGLPTLTKYHGLAIAGWLGIGALYNAFMYLKFGSEQATVWLNGYLLELIFSLENIFVFHVIIESFGTPTGCVQKALFFIVCCQVVFELVLYMGVADVIDSLGFLPYILGAWLTYLGIHSALESDDHSDFDILETFTVRNIRRVLGDRLQLGYDDTGGFFRCSHGRCHMTLLGLVFFCLLVADFVLEIDVTLTKIEQTPDDYLSFTSSALAGFAVPELFFVARDLFRRFGLLKFGISFVLVFYGTQMLFPGLVVLSPLDGCGVIVLVMIACILLSMLSQTFGKAEPESEKCTPGKKQLRLHSESDADAAAGKGGGYGAMETTAEKFMRRNHYSFVFGHESNLPAGCCYLSDDEGPLETLPR